MKPKYQKFDVVYVKRDPGFSDLMLQIHGVRYHRGVFYYTFLKCDLEYPEQDLYIPELKQNEDES